MRKLKLEALQVESFDTTATQGERGTVHGQQCTCGGPYTCAWTCDDHTCLFTCDDPTCAVSCNGTCEASCDSCYSCWDSCRPRDCPIDIQQ